jgi:hypothetical protein
VRRDREQRYYSNGSITDKAGLELDYRPTFTFRADEILMDEPIRTELSSRILVTTPRIGLLNFLRAI